MGLILDHYFAVKFEGKPSERFRTLQGAMARAEDFPGLDGDIWYYDTPSSAPTRHMVHYGADGSIEDMDTQ